MDWSPTDFLVPYTMLNCWERWPMVDQGGAATGTWAQLPWEWLTQMIEMMSYMYHIHTWQVNSSIHYLIVEKLQLPFLGGDSLNRSQDPSLPCAVFSCTLLLEGVVLFSTHQIPDASPDTVHSMVCEIVDFRIWTQVWRGEAALAFQLKRRVVSLWSAAARGQALESWKG